jgi:hypothetical protein
MFSSLRVIAVPRLSSNETSTQQLDLDLESHRVSESKLATGFGRD